MMSAEYDPQAPPPPPSSPRSRFGASTVQTILPRRIRTLNKNEWQDVAKIAAARSVSTATPPTSKSKKVEQLFWPTNKEFFVQRSSFWTVVHSIHEEDFLSREEAREDVREFTAEVALEGVSRMDSGSNDEDSDSDDDDSDGGSSSREAVVTFQLLRVASNILLVAPCQTHATATAADTSSGPTGSTDAHRFRPLFELSDLVSVASYLSFADDQQSVASTASSTSSRRRSGRTGHFAGKYDILINPYFFGGFCYYHDGQLVTGTVGTDNYDQLVKQEELVHHQVQLVSSAAAVPGSPTTTVALDEEHARTFLHLVSKEWRRNIHLVQARYQYEHLQQGGSASSFTPPGKDVDSLQWGKRTYASMVLLTIMLSNVLDIHYLPQKIQQRRLQHEAEEAALRAVGSTVVAADAAVEVVGDPTWDEKPATAFSQEPTGNDEEEEEEDVENEDFRLPPPPPPPPPPELPDGLLYLPDKTDVGNFIKARRIPGSGRSLVDKRTYSPGRAFLDDSDRTDIAAQRVTGQQKEARDLLLETIEKFTESKSFFTIVEKEQVGDRLPLWSPDANMGSNNNVQKQTIDEEEDEDEDENEDDEDSTELGDTTDHGDTDPGDTDEAGTNESDVEEGDADDNDDDDDDDASEIDGTMTNKMVQTTFVLRFDSSIASASSSSSSSPPKNSKLFHMIRIQPSVVLAAPSAMDPALIAYCQKVLRQSLLPDDGKFDLLLNPYFFCGSFNERTANVDRSLICTDGEEDGVVACMCERFARCFLLCFHNLWKPVAALNSTVDYNGIPEGYCTYAASLMLQVYGPYTVREVNACEGVVGMYSIARTAGFTTTAERANYLRLAQIREMFYFSRCTKIGIRLNRDVSLDVIERQCSVPWSTYTLMDLRNKTNDTEEKNAVNDTSMAIFSIQTMADTMNSYTMAPPRTTSKTPGEDTAANKKGEETATFNEATDGETATTMAGELTPNPSNEDDAQEEEEAAATAAARLGDRMSEGTALFFASVARELGLLGTAMVTPINHVSLLYNYDAEESPTKSMMPQDQVREASQLLRRLSDQTRELPGAALVPSKGWGVRNLQLGEPAYEGHVVWIKSYSEKDSIVATIAIALATALAAWLETAVFHFVIALIAVEYVGEEVSIQGTFNVLWQGRGNARRGIELCGHLMRSEKFALVVLTVALGMVEAASDMVETELPFDLEIHIAVFYAFLIWGCVVSCGLLLLTRHVWSQFEFITPQEAHTYSGVLRRDGSVGCLLTGEKGTGFRAADDINNVAVGPLQAQELDRSIYRGLGLHTTTSPPLQRVEKWVLCG